jgi:transposase
VQLTEQSRLMAGQAELLAEQSKLIEALRVELAASSRKAGRDSSNSSQPPSQDGPGSKAKAKADNDSGEPADASTGGPSDGSGEPSKPGSRRRRQGGQPGRRGSGLARVAKPDRTEKVEPPACGGCGGSLAGAEGKVASSMQVGAPPAA